MTVTQMKLERIFVLVKPIAMLALNTFLILVLCFDMSVHTCSVDRFITIRTLNMSGVLDT